MKTLIGLAPWALVLALAGAAIWLALDRDLAAGEWLLGGLLVAHGLVHVLFLVPAPARSAGTPGGGDWPFDLSRSWPVARAGLDAGAVRLVGTGLIAVVVVGFVLGGLATAGVLVPEGWWRDVIVPAAGASLVLLALCFHPQLILGVAVDGVLLWLVLASTWTPGIA